VPSTEALKVGIVLVNDNNAMASVPTLTMIGGA